MKFRIQFQTEAPSKNAGGHYFYQTIAGMLTKETILEKLRAVKPELQTRYGLKGLGLFGSFARDEQGPHSDIDLIIALSRPSFKDYCRVSEVMEQLFPGIRVQTVSRGAIKPAYFERLKDDIIYA